MKRLFSLLLCLLLLVSLTAAVHAGTVTYDGDARTFLFQPGSDASPTDLFGSFKEVMPGDVRTEQIRISNDVDRNVTVNVYVRSLGAQEQTEDFLSQLDLTVTAADGEELFAAPADQTAQLTDWVLLGTVYSGGEVTLDLTLEVPLTLGNEYQNQIGYIDWEFKVEQLPVEPGDPKPPYTGDETPLLLYGVLTAASLAVILVLIRKIITAKK